MLDAQVLCFQSARWNQLPVSVPSPEQNVLLRSETVIVRVFDVNFRYYVT